MKPLRASLLCLLMLCAAPLDGTAKEWRGIVPLKSTRADVERLLGPQPENVLRRYELPHEFVSVEYADRPCNARNPDGWPEPPPGWNVPPGTVIAIRVELKEPASLASLGLDLTKFQKGRGDADVPQHHYYFNEEEGFNLEVFDYGGDIGQMVKGYIHGPRASEAHLRCPATPAK